MKNYTVRTSCEVAGHWRAAGSTLNLTDEQARELVPPFGRVLFLTPADAPPTNIMSEPEQAAEEEYDAKFDGSKRANRRGAH